MHHAGLAVREGDWTVPQGAVHRLRGRRLAVIGVGGVGVRVAERAQAFGIETVGFDPYVEDWSTIPAEPAESFEDAVAEADFISLHVPLTEESHHLSNADSIAGMRRAPIVVNTARGPLVDADAAVAALDAGQLGGVALDVTEEEPPAGRSPAAHSPARGPHTAHGVLLGRGAGGAAAPRGRGGRAGAQGRAARPPGEPRGPRGPFLIGVSGEPRPDPRLPDLAGQVALVTGGSKGIGAATARMLAANGVKVAVNARSQAGIDAIVEELRAAGAEAIGISGDAAELAEVERVRDQVEAELGPIDILLPFAGGFGAFTPIEETSEARVARGHRLEPDLDLPRRAGDRSRR